MPAVAVAPELLALAALIVAYGLIKFGAVFTAALFGTAEGILGWVPWAGSRLKAPLHSIEKRINSRMAQAARGVEGGIAATWHALAYLIEQTGEAIWDATRLGARALWLVEVKYPLKVLEALAHKGISAAGVVTKTYPTVAKRITVVQKVDRASLARLGRSLHALEARVAALPHIGAGTIALPFPRLGSLERRARAQAGRLGRVEHKLGALTFTALVAAALARLGAGWLRCTNTRRAGKALCGMDANLLESLLAGALIISGSFSIRDFALGMEQIGDEAVGAITGFVREA